MKGLEPEWSNPRVLTIFFLFERNDSVAWWENVKTYLPSPRPPACVLLQGWWWAWKKMVLPWPRKRETQHFWGVQQSLHVFSSRIYMHSCSTYVKLFYTYSVGFTCLCWLSPYGGLLPAKTDCTIWQECWRNGSGNVLQSLASFGPGSNPTGAG